MHIKLIIQVDIVCLHKICNFFNYMQNASVLIDGSVMRKACGDEKTAKDVYKRQEQGQLIERGKRQETKRKPIKAGKGRQAVEKEQTEERKEPKEPKELKLPEKNPTMKRVYHRSGWA